MTDNKKADQAREGLLDSVKGKAKEVIGAVTGNDSLTAEGQLQQVEAQTRKSWPTLEEIGAHAAVRGVVKVDCDNGMWPTERQLARHLGSAGDSDLEVLMQAAASAWPEQRPVQNLRFENGALTLAAPGWNDPEITQFRETLRPSGWLVEAADGRLTLKRGTQASR